MLRAITPTNSVPAVEPFRPDPITIPDPYEPVEPAVHPEPQRDPNPFSFPDLEPPDAPAPKA